MSRRASGTQERKNRRVRTILWTAGLTAVVITLLYLEQAAILYVLATLGVTALLVVVAVADLSGAHKAGSDEPVPADDAAALGTGISATLPPTATAARAPRSARSK